MSLDLFPCYHMRSDNSGLLTMAEAWDLVPQQVFPEMLLWDRYRATKTESNGTTRLTALLEELSVPGTRQANLVDRSHQVACQRSQLNPTQEQEARGILSEGQQAGKLCLRPERGPRDAKNEFPKPVHGTRIQGIGHLLWTTSKCYILGSLTKGNYKISFSCSL